MTTTPEAVSQQSVDIEVRLREVELDVREFKSDMRHVATRA